MTMISDLLKKIDAYIVETKIKPTTFGILAANDGKFIKKLREGKDIRTATYEKVLAYINQSKKIKK